MFSKNDTKTALEQAIANAEDAMKALRLAQDPAEKKKWRETACRHMQEAETLKAAPAQSSTSVRATLLKEPISTRQPDKAEQILVLKAGFLNNDKFPPWTNEPPTQEFVASPDSSLFTDNAHFSLSKYQQKVFAGWERPSVALARVVKLGASADAEPTMQHIGNIDLVQDASTDCSVVASLCAGVARALKGHARLLRPVLFPQDDGTPSLSYSGKYIVRLNFNGSYRKVVIDDRLPASKTDRIIHVVDRLNPTLLWPALVEKAYLKIRGGYDFPGSNSATDLWIITGWLPEQVFLDSDDLDLGSFWTKISNAFAFGDVLITMGTGKMSKKLEKEIGLAGEHDYAVVDVKEVNGQRLMLVKNPWCEGTNWYRVPRRQSKADIADDESLAMASPRDLLNADDQLSPGTFWMDIGNAAQYFESIYLNWNPGLFTHRQDIHFAWDLTKASTDGSRRLHAALIDNPQFSLSTTDGGTVWLLLCRHLRNSAPLEDGTHQIDLSGFIALSAFAAGGSRIKVAARPLNKTNFVDSPQILLKLQDCKPNSVYTIVPLEQEMASTYHTFTLSSFSNSSMSVGHAVAPFPYTTSIVGSWTRDTAGGNASSSTYGTNPQFKLVLKRASRVSLLLQAANADLNVNIRMVHGGGQRVYAVRSRDILLDSADYRRRCCVAESKTLIDAGTYTIICSTFETQQCAQFELIADSSEAVTLAAVPKEGAGRLRVSSKAVFPIGVTQIAAKLTPKRLSNLQLVTNQTPGTKSMEMLLTMTIEQGYGVQRRLLVSSAQTEHAAARQARIQDVNLSTEMLKYGDVWIVLARTCVSDQADEQAVIVDVYIDQVDALDIGEWA